MRRWRGPIGNWIVELRLLSQDDDERINQILAQTLDAVLQSLATSILGDTVITNNNSYVWISDNNEISNLNARQMTANTVGADFLNNNNIHIASVFTFVTNGPVGRGRDPVRYFYISIFIKITYLPK